ncbi:MAG: hypothetical protein WCF84_26615 [Anaerolineae bacterium]
MRFLIGLTICLTLMLALLGCAPPRPTATPAGVLSRATPAPTILRGSPTPADTPESPGAQALPTARPHLYDEVGEEEILGAVFPNLSLTPADDRFHVQGSGDWTVWVNDRDEGYVTQDQRSELLVIVANLVGPNPPKEETAYGPSSDLIVMLEKKDGKLVVTHRQSVLPAASPEANDVRIERTVDVDHNGTDELLLTTNDTQSPIVRTEAHLLQWQGDKLAEIWKGIEQDDNTGASNQGEYHSYQALIDFQDVDQDGKEEILMSGERIIYKKDAQGNPDFTTPDKILDDRQVYNWNGQSYVLDNRFTTPPAPAPTP